MIRELILPKDFWVRNVVIIQLMIIAVFAISRIGVPYPVSYAAMLALIAALFIATYMSRYISLESYILSILLIAVSIASDIYQRYQIAALATAAVLILMAPKVRLEFTIPAVRVTYIALKRQYYRTVNLPRSLADVAARIRTTALLTASTAAAVAAYMLLGGAIILATAIYSIVSFSLFFLSYAPRKPRAKVVSSTSFLETVFSYRFLTNAVHRMVQRYSKLFDEAGMLVDRFAYISRFVGMAIQWLFISPAVAVALYLALSLANASAAAYILPPIIAASVFILLYRMPVIVLTLKRMSRASSIDRVFPLFLALFSVALNAGVLSVSRLFKDFTSGRYADFSKELSREANIIMNIAGFRKRIDIEAIEEYASTNPSSYMKSFMRDLVNSIRHGASLKEFAGKMLDITLSEYRRSKETSAEKLVNIGGMMVVSLALLTLPLVMVLFFNPSAVMGLVLVYDLVFLPLIPAALYFITQTLQIGLKDEYPKPDLAIPAAMGVAAAIAATLARLDIAVSVAAVAAAVAAGYYIDFRAKSREISEAEKSIPRFLYDLKELIKSMSLIDALREISENKTYPESFRRSISIIVSHRVSGRSIRELRWVSGSWIMRFIQILLAKIDEIGTDVEDILIDLENLFRSFYDLKKSIRAKLGTVMFVAMFAPFLMAMGSGIVAAIIDLVPRIDIDITQVGGAGVGIGAAQSSVMRFLTEGVDPSVRVLIDLSIVEVSIILAVILTKILYNTLRNTKLIVVSCVIAIAALYMKQYIGSLIFGGVG